jgi:hypothetical protein
MAVTTAREWGFLSLIMHKGLVLLRFRKCTMNLGSCAASPFIAWRDRGPLPTGKGGAPDQGASWITRETQTRTCTDPVEI